MPVNGGRLRLRIRSCLYDPPIRESPEKACAAKAFLYLWFPNFRLGAMASNAQYQTVSVEIRQDAGGQRYALVTIDNPPVNAGSRQVRQDLL